MFKNTFQSGLLSIFFSCGSNPLALWDMEVKNGHIKRLTDAEVSSIVLEIVSTNVATTYISCPRKNQVLGIKLPFLVMIVKNLKRYFSFEITILDDKNMRRRFRISNFQSTTKIKPFCTSMPIGLSSGWNQIQFNLADFTRRAYGTAYVEALRVQIHANVRLRRIYFCDRLYQEEELPQDYKLYLPLEKKTKKKESKDHELTKAKPIPRPVDDLTERTESAPHVSPKPESIPEVEAPKDKTKVEFDERGTEIVLNQPEDEEEAQELERGHEGDAEPSELGDSEHGDLEPDAELEPVADSQPGEPEQEVAATADG